MLMLTDVSKQYIDNREEQVTALDRVCLSLPDKGLVIINGTSGCGKTTLLNILGGLDNPTTGEVSLDGVRIDNRDEKWWDEYRSSSIGFIYQDFNLLENMSVRDNIALPMELQNVNEEDKQEKINSIINGLGLEGELDKKARQLSGGQKQRVAIARALVTDSKIILADEPTGNLDRENSDNVFKILKNVAKERLVVVVTHDDYLAREYADRLIKIAYGKIESDVIYSKESDDGKEGCKNDILVKTFFEEEKKNAKELSLKKCYLFAKETMKQRRIRCSISVLIFSITILFILMVSEIVFRSDGETLAGYVEEKNANILLLYTKVKNNYSGLVESENIYTGSMFYETIRDSVSKNRVVSCDSARNMTTSEGKQIYATTMYLNSGNEQYFEFEGELPNGDNEMAISAPLLRKLGKKDAIIGSSIDISGKDYKITGIVTAICGNPIEEVDVYDDKEDIDDFKNLVFLSDDVPINRVSNSSIYMSGFGVVEYNEFIYQMTTYNDVCPVAEGTRLIAGRMPQSDNEILLSVESLNMRGLSNEDVVGKSYKVKDLYDKEYGTSYWNMINLYDYIGDSITVVGISDDEGYFYVTKSLYNKLYEKYTKYHKNGYYLLVDDREINDDLKELVKNDIRIEGENYQKIYELIDNVDVVKRAMVMIAAVFTLLAVLQMISLYSYSINDNKKTIGILRTLGVNKSDTKKIFTIECVMVSTLSFIVALVIGMLLTHIANGFINKSILGFAGFNLIRMRPEIILFVGIVNFMLSVIAVLVPLGRYSKMKIIELIK